MFNKLALNQNGTHNRPDLVYFAFPEDCAQQIKRSGLATEGKLAKKINNLFIFWICFLHFMVKDMKVSVSDHSSVTGCLTLFDLIGTKKRPKKKQTSAIEH